MRLALVAWLAGSALAMPPQSQVTANRTSSDVLMNNQYTIRYKPKDSTATISHRDFYRFLFNLETEAAGWAHRYGADNLMKDEMSAGSKKSGVVLAVAPGPVARQQPDMFTWGNLCETLHLLETTFETYSAGGSYKEADFVAYDHRNNVPMMVGKLRSPR